MLDWLPRTEPRRTLTIFGLVAALAVVVIVPLSPSDGDDPGEFLDLVHELRSTESSAYTESETPIFTCVSASIERALNALDGEAVHVDPTPLPETATSTT